MSEWQWVALGYVVVYGALGMYSVGLVRRGIAARRRLEDRAP